MLDIWKPCKPRKVKQKPITLTQKIRAMLEDGEKGISASTGAVSFSLLIGLPLLPFLVSSGLLLLLDGQLGVITMIYSAR